MKVTQLIQVMKYHLKNFNTTGNPVTNQTKHSDILRDNDGYGTATSKRIYKGFIRWTLRMNGHEDKAWPQNWMDMTVAELAQKLL